MLAQPHIRGLNDIPGEKQISRHWLRSGWPLLGFAALHNILFEWRAELSTRGAGPRIC
jgi:hypothetical protein